MFIIQLRPHRLTGYGWRWQETQLDFSAPHAAVSRLVRLAT